jgi:hypothetical protein
MAEDRTSSTATRSASAPDSDAAPNYDSGLMPRPPQRAASVFRPPSARCCGASTSGYPRASRAGWLRRRTRGTSDAPLSISARTKSVAGWPFWAVPAPHPTAVRPAGTSLSLDSSSLARRLKNGATGSTLRWLRASEKDLSRCGRGTDPGQHRGRRRDERRLRHAHFRQDYALLNSSNEGWGPGLRPHHQQDQ